MCIFSQAKKKKEKSLNLDGSGQFTSLRPFFSNNEEKARIF